VSASQPSMLANYLLVSLLWQVFDYEWVEEVSLLAVKLVIKLVVGVSSQLGSLFLGTILGLGTSKAVWPGWMVLDRNLGDEWSFWGEFV